MNQTQPNQPEEINNQPESDVSEISSHELMTPISISDRYAFVEEIGHGAQGRIYKAVRLSDKQIVVIKQLNVSSVKTWKEYELFKREGNVLKSLDMPGVAHFYDAIECLDEEPAYSYIVQEYIHGASLKKMIEDGHRFKMDDVYEILVQALDILSRLHAHEPPVIHRDIKPSNIMITPDDAGHLHVTIIDFGAVANPQIQGGGSTVAGTYGYMPPEQLTGKPCPASDVYALAAVGVQLFSGKSPANMMMKDFRLIFEPEMQDKPHELVTLLRQMLEPNAENRLADIPSIIEQLNAFRGDKFEGEVEKVFSLGYANSYEEALKAVQSVGENGNFDLWQTLPDKTPRNVPEAYESRMNTDIVLAYPIANLKVRPKGMMSTCVGCGVIFFGVILGCLIFGNFSEIAFFLTFWVCICGPTMFVILWMCYSEASRILKKNNNIAQIQTGNANISGSHSDEHGNEQKHGISGEPRSFCNELLTNGRKAIATISSIKYLPMEKEQITVLEDMTSDGRYVRYNKNYFYTGLPAFEVQYMFNPPDDRRKENIIHRFISHVNPMEYCKIGDPLPILYLIEDNFFYDTVKSMPFPYPIGDIYDLVQVLDESSSKYEHSHENSSHESINVDEMIRNAVKQRNVHRVKTTEDLCHELKYYFERCQNALLEQYIEKLDLENMCEELQIELCNWLEKAMNNCERSTVHAACMECLWKLGFDNKLNHKQPKRAMSIIANYLTHRPRSWLLPTRDAIIRMFAMIEEYGKLAVYSKNDDFINVIWLSLIDIYGDIQAQQMLRATILERYYQLAPKEYVRQMYDYLKKCSNAFDLKCIQGNIDYWLKIYQEAYEF